MPVTRAMSRDEVVVGAESVEVYVKVVDEEEEKVKNRGSRRLGRRI